MANNQLYNNIGNEIKNALMDGLNKGDFSGLNTAITNSVNAVLDEATSQLEGKGNMQNGSANGPVNTSSHTYSTYNYGDATRRKQQELARERERIRERQAELLKQQQNNRAAANERRRQVLEANRQHAEMQQAVKSGRAVIADGKLLPTKINTPDAGNIVQIVFGGIGLGIFALPAIVCVLMALSGVPDTVSTATAMTGLTVGSSVLLGSGISGHNLVNRARRYATLCGENMYIKLSQLANATGMSESRLAKDIRKMLKKGYYPEGYLDESNTTLMLSNEVYKQYEQMLLASAMPKQQEELTNDELSELGVMIRDGNEAIKKLHELNDNIPGEVITNKLTCLEGLLTQIFNCVKEHPEQMDRMHKLMDYYLPTMLKLVEAYEEYDKVNPSVPEVESAKAEIEKTLDTINEAFVQLLNNLFQKSVWDVTSDAQVLQTMLAQDGLARDQVQTM